MIITRKNASELLIEHDYNINLNQLDNISPKYIQETPMNNQKHGKMKQNKKHLYYITYNGKGKHRRQ